MILKLFVNLAPIIDFISIFGNTCSMNFATSQAIYGGNLCLRAAYLCIKRETGPLQLQRSPPHSAVRGEKYMLSGSLLKFIFMTLERGLLPSVVWDKLFCKFPLFLWNICW